MSERRSEQPRKKQKVAHKEAPKVAPVEASVTADGVEEEAGGNEPCVVAKLINTSIGITSDDIKKLQEAGYKTVDTVVSVLSKDLLAVKGISTEKAIRILKEGAKLVPVFITAAEYYKKCADFNRIVTGSKQLDELLGGGIEKGSLTEVIGEFRTGKTLFCHRLAVTCQLPVSRGGVEGKCIYIDTEGTFRPEKLLAVAKRCKLNGNVVLGNVSYARATSYNHQCTLLVLARRMMTNSRYALLIVDSCIAVYRRDNQEREGLCNPQLQRAKFMQCLQRLADEFGVAVLITTQIESTAQMSQMFNPDPKESVGGNVAPHAPKVRLYLRKPQMEMRTCKVITSLNVPGSEAVLAINPEGINLKD